MKDAPPRGDEQGVLQVLECLIWSLRCYCTFDTFLKLSILWKLRLLEVWFVHCGKTFSVKVLLVELHGFWTFALYLDWPLEYLFCQDDFFLLESEQVHSQNISICVLFFALIFIIVLDHLAESWVWPFWEVVVHQIWAKEVGFYQTLIHVFDEVDQKPEDCSWVRYMLKEIHIFGPSEVFLDYLKLNLPWRRKEEFLTVLILEIALVFCKVFDW